MLRTNISLLAVIATLLFCGCDPSGGPAIINQYPFPVKITILFSNANEITKRTVLLQPGIAYYPGARNKNQRNITGLLVKKEDDEELLNVSRKEIEEVLTKNKGATVFYIGSDGLTIKKSK